MRLERVDIENYRAVRRLAIGLDSVTTVIGEHHCGKSSLIKAIAMVLDPAGGEVIPTFTDSDFHRPFGADDDTDRASRLAITIRLRERREDEQRRRRPDTDADAPAPGVPLPDRFAIRVEARRRDEGDPETRITVLDVKGREIGEADPVATLGLVRRLTPALVIRWRWDPARRKPSPGDVPFADARRHITKVFRRLSLPGMVVTQEIESVMDDVRRTALGLSEQFIPTPDRPRSIEDLADTPQPLVTDLRAALGPDAGPQRQLALLLLVGAALESLPPSGLAPEADPILLFDDIESNLHPIWLAAVTSVATNLPLQQVITTHSSEVLNWMPLRSLRRLVRTPHNVQARLVERKALSPDELRRVTYHLRLNRGGALFARCWVLVEGETEAWLLPEFARLCGVEFPVEGIRCVEFAQCGIMPLLRLARSLRIGWVLLVDGDGAGRGYAESARSQLRPGEARTRLLRLNERDIEQYLYRHGFAEVIRKAAGRSPNEHGPVDARHLRRLIRDATKRVSKPGLALAILEEANTRGAKGVPKEIRRLAETARDVARRALEMDAD
ncbi:MAG: DUF2813 domain-containing protein [Planctomycetes bacterium]|nr:DUF2813 domain-containing protein [Planctomycetota bacterium]